MNVSEYIWKTLADFGINHAFLVTGGGAMHLNNALKNENRITYTCCHHEQACSIAAEGYYRSSGKIPVVSVTTGPGGTNAMTGVLGAWLDSIPMIVISGQVKHKTTIDSCKDINLRQLGDQEYNIIDSVKSMTKYSISLNNKLEVGIVLKKAYLAATTGRFGPVWIDIPLDIQGAVLSESDIEMINKSEIKDIDENIKYDCDFSDFYDLLSTSKRPVILAGHAIELSKSIELFKNIINEIKIPVLQTFNGINALNTLHEFNFGRIGTIGNRYSNIILQNSDLVICLGTRNNIRQISYNWENFAKNAKLVLFDIDQAELKKPTLKPFITYHCNIANFLKDWINNIQNNDYSNWIDKCQDIKKNFNPINENNASDKNGINPYFFMYELTKNLNEDVNIVAGNGTACVSLFQTGIFKKNQKVFWNSGCASMGYDIPAAEGAAIGRNKITICLAGDGSSMMNIQELQTIKTNNLPVKIFILDNNGYSSIRQTQTNLFNKNFIGCIAKNDIDFPDFCKLAEAFGIQSYKIENNLQIDDIVINIQKNNNPELILVKIDPTANFSPKLSSRRNPDGSMESPSLEDMYPFIDKKHLVI